MATDIFDMTDTWNDGATTFNAIKMAVTNTDSGSDSRIISLVEDSTVVFAAGIVNNDSTIELNDGDAALAADGGGGGRLFFQTGGSSRITLSTGALQLSSVALLVGASSSGPTVDDEDTSYLRTASPGGVAGFRAYGSRTDASNYERIALDGDDLKLESAGTGTANRDLGLIPAGTGVVKFGTHSAIGSETVTGFITIKDSGGTTRKIAVVS